MNSKQRRNQRTIHRVQIEMRDNERLSEYQRRCDNAMGWLQWQTKRKNWRVYRSGPYSHEFVFRGGGIASVFALKWT